MWKYRTCSDEWKRKAWWIKELVSRLESLVTQLLTDWTGRNFKQKYYVFHSNLKGRSRTRYWLRKTGTLKCKSQSWNSESQSFKPWNETPLQGSWQLWKRGGQLTQACKIGRKTIFWLEGTELTKGSERYTQKSWTRERSYKPRNKTWIKERNWLKQKNWPQQMESPSMVRRTGSEEENWKKKKKNPPGKLSQQQKNEVSKKVRWDSGANYGSKENLQKAGQIVGSQQQPGRKKKLWEQTQLPAKSEGELFSKGEKPNWNWNKSIPSKNIRMKCFPENQETT